MSEGKSENDQDKSLQQSNNDYESEKKEQLSHNQFLNEEKSEKKNEENQQFTLQMQIIQFQDQTINNLKGIILEKEADIQKKSQELNHLKQLLSQVQNQTKLLQQQHESEFNNLQMQYNKMAEEFKRMKTIMNQSTNPDIVIETLQLKEQVVILSQCKTKLEMDLKESQTRLIQVQQLVTELQRENYQYKSISLPQTYNNRNEYQGYKQQQQSEKSFLSYQDKQKQY